MTFTGKELAMVYTVLHADAGGNQIVFKGEDLVAAFAILEKIIKNVEKVEEKIRFIDGDVEFSDAEKKALYGSILARGWVVEDGDAYASLMKKLST